MSNPNPKPPQGWSPLDEHGNLLTIYLLGLHLAGLWLPLFGSAIWGLNLHGLLLVVAVIMGVFSFLIFILLRIWLRLLRDWLDNRLLIFMLYVLGAELLAIGFFFLQNGFINWANFVQAYWLWRSRTLPKHIFYYPVYAVALGGFLIETLYKPEPFKSQSSDILDDMDEQ